MLYIQYKILVHVSASFHVWLCYSQTHSKVLKEWINHINLSPTITNVYCHQCIFKLLSFKSHYEIIKELKANTNKCVMRFIMCQLTKSFSLKIKSIRNTHQQLTEIIAPPAGNDLYVWPPQASVMEFHCKNKTILKVLLKYVLFFYTKQYINISFYLDSVTSFSLEQGARLLSRT